MVNLRTEFGPSSSKIFADILDNLNSAGFALAKIEKRFWTMGKEFAERWNLVVCAATKPKGNDSRLGSRRDD